MPSKPTGPKITASFPLRVPDQKNSHSKHILEREVLQPGGIFYNFFADV
jgi:hypothetical protein